MAQFINSHPDREKCFFVRDSAGIYWYGSKRIFVDLKRGNLIVRVGGGHMSLTEFIETHYENEKHEIPQRDSLESN